MPNLQIREQMGSPKWHKKRKRTSNNRRAWIVNCGVWPFFFENATLFRWSNSPYWTVLYLFFLNSCPREILKTICWSCQEESVMFYPMDFCSNDVYGLSPLIEQHGIQFQPYTDHEFLLLFRLWGQKFYDASHDSFWKWCFLWWLIASILVLFRDSTEGTVFFTIARHGQKMDAIIYHSFRGSLLSLKSLISTYLYIQSEKLNLTRNTRQGTLVKLTTQHSKIFRGTWVTGLYSAYLVP